MDKLGIEPSLLIAQIVNFLIIFVVLSKMLYKPILGMLENRRKKIEEGLALTESMKTEAEKLEAKKEKVLAEARADGRALIEDAKKQAKEEGQKAIAEAHKEAEEILVKARKQTVDEREAMQKSVYADAVQLAESMAQKVLASAIGDKTAHDIVKKHIGEVARMKSA
jgi:F-type H+-transporting ATPase subunit b